jgi:hypothetical protein
MPPNKSLRWPTGISHTSCSSNKRALRSVARELEPSLHRAGTSISRIAYGPQLILMRAQNETYKSLHLGCRGVLTKGQENGK